MSCNRQKFRYIRERFVIGLTDQEIMMDFQETFARCKARSEWNKAQRVLKKQKQIGRE